MSTIAIIAILVALILGGVIAALGDRIGSKVGKARLRLFNLRPKQTATLVTVATGTLIAASTLGVLLASSEPLRQGLFDLDKIKRDLRIARDQLIDAKREKRNIEEELEAAKTEQSSVQKQLKSIKGNFERARKQLKSVSGQAKQLRSDIQILLSDRNQLQQQKQQLDGQIKNLKTEIESRDTQLQQRDLALKQQEGKIVQQDQILRQRQQKLQALEQQLQSLQSQQDKLQIEINKQDQQIANLDEEIALKDQSLQQREVRLTELESQLAFLQRQVTVLEDYYQTYQELRERQIAILRGQLLAFGAIKIVDNKAVIPAIDELLRQANRNAIKAIDGNNGQIEPTERVVKITKAQVEQLIQQLQEGQEYVVRILSAGNYVQGEKEVRVFADVVPNQQIFNQEDIIAQVSIDPESRSEEEIQKRLDLLLAAAQFRARRSGIMGPIQVEEGQIKTLITFIEKVSQSEDPIDEIQAIAYQDTYTVGPLRLRLLAIDEGDIIFSTKV